MAMVVPVQHIMSAPGKTIILLDMSGALEHYGISTNMDCVMICVSAANVQGWSKPFGDSNALITTALHRSVVPALKSVAGRLTSMSPKEKDNFDADCSLLCLMDERLNGTPLPIFWYQEPCCANCRAAKRQSGGSGKLLRCTGCNGMALYCSKDCQTADWGRHKPHCKLSRLLPEDFLQRVLRAADVEPC